MTSPREVIAPTRRLVTDGEHLSTCCYLMDCFATQNIKNIDGSWYIVWGEQRVTPHGFQRDRGRLRCCPFCMAPLELELGSKKINGGVDQ